MTQIGNDISALFPFCSICKVAMAARRAKHSIKKNTKASVFSTKCILHKNNIISICFFLSALLIAAVTHLLVPFAFGIIVKSIFSTIWLGHAWRFMRTHGNHTKQSHCVRGTRTVIHLHSFISHSFIMVWHVPLICMLNSR